MTTAAPSIRVSTVRDTPVLPANDFVVYWMTAERRTHSSFGLQHAVAYAEQLGKPLLVLEPLDTTHRWASARFHRFIIDGMRSNAAALHDTPINYWPWVGERHGDGAGLLAALSARACVIVTDERPSYRYPKLLKRAASNCHCRVEAVDGSGVLPLRLAPKRYSRAVDFRRFIHKTFANEPPEFPLRNPWEGAILAPFTVDLSDLQAIWPVAPLDRLSEPRGLEHLPIDHSVAPVHGKTGGSQEALRRWREFHTTRFTAYTERNHPDEDASTGLSPWLHFGHISASLMAQDILESEFWTPESMVLTRVSKQEGAWGLSAAAESLLEELMTWRELCFQNAFLDPEGHASFDGLPGWAKTSLHEHQSDPRPMLYSLEQLANAQTDDPLWNAAQRQLREEGIIHNYLRMLWGKKVLAWTADPETCFNTLVELNNRYALDGRDPNSYGGIAWVLGRYDRAWGPQRPIYGKIRYMTSDSTRRKLRLKHWLERWSA